MVPIKPAIVLMEILLLETTVVVSPVPSKPVQVHNQQIGILLHAQVHTGNTGPGNTSRYVDC